MGFTIWCPSEQATPVTAKTTNDITDQIWKEFVSLRYSRPNNNFPKSTSFWIDQAKIYFLDATHNHWRSAGLLYYYSFLNLAKSYLVKKRKFSFRSLDTKSIYHGLKAIPQNLLDIIDYSVDICPLIQNNSSNVFSNFYQLVTDQKWPFPKIITIKLKDIIGYCHEITQEFEELFQIESQVVDASSLLRKEKDLVWFEIFVHNSQVKKITSQISGWNLNSIPFSDLSGKDKNDWLISNKKTVYGSRNYCILRTEQHKFTPETENTVFNELQQEAKNKLSKNIILSVNDIDENAEWLFIPDLIINGKSLRWHPILSDYIVSFALSNILRYQPQILKDGSKNSFIMDGWCTQSAITTLKYFFMLFTSPPLRVIKF